MRGGTLACGVGRLALLRLDRSEPGAGRPLNEHRNIVAYRASLEAVVLLMDDALDLSAGEIREPACQALDDLLNSVRLILFLHIRILAPRS